MKQKKTMRRMVALLLLLVLTVTVVPQSLYASDSASGVKEEVTNSTAGLQEEKPDTDTDPTVKKEDEQLPVPEVMPGKEGDEASQPDNVSPEPEAKPEELPKEKKDWSGNVQEIDVKLYKAAYRNAQQAETEAVAEDGRVDLSQVSLNELQNISLFFSFQLIKDKNDRLIKGQDTFSFTIPSDYLIVADKTEPTEVYKSMSGDMNVATDLKVGTYIIKNQVVTVTMDDVTDTDDVTDVSALIQIPASVKADSLSKENVTEAVIPWGENNRSFVVLPVIGDTTENKTEDITGAASADIKKDSSKESVLGSQMNPIQVPEFSVYAIKSSKPLEEASVTKYTYTADKLPDGFQQVDLGVYSKKGGYSNSSTDAELKVGFQFSVTMDDDYLYKSSEKYMNYPGFPVQGKNETDADYFVRIQKWITENDGEVPKLTYTYDLGENFRKENQAAATVKDTAGNVIGTYRVEGGILKVDIDKLNYFRESVYMDFSFTASIDRSKLKDEPQEQVLDKDGKLVFQTIGTTDPGGGDPDQPNYSVEKKAPGRVTDTAYLYEITVTAKEPEVLNGKYLSDIIPPGLQARTLLVGLNGAPPQPVDASTYLDGGNVKYQFEALNGEESNKITAADIKLTVELTAEKYQELIDSGKGTASWEFKNVAVLKDSDKELAKSEEVSTKMTQNFLKKSGKEANLEGTRYAWTLNLDTYLPSMDQGYLADTICWTDHTYDFNQGITITPEAGSAYTIKGADIKEVSGGPPWETLTIGQITKLKEDNGIGDSQAFYYIYEETSGASNPFGETSKVQRAVLLIPYQGLQGMTTNKSVTVRYYTDLNMHGLSADAYWEKLSDNTYSPEIANEVNLLWNNKGGIGPGPAAQDRVNIGKEVDTAINVISKKGLSFDSDTKMAKWAIDVNKIGVNLSDIVLTDTLKKGAYDLDELKIRYYKYKAGTGNDSQTLIESGVLSETASGMGYTILLDSNDNSVITIRLADPRYDIANKTYEFYTLQLEAPLTDPAAYANPGAEGKGHTENAITITATGLDKSYTATGTLDFPNVLIEKDTVGSYDYYTHELKWNVTVNPRHVNIYNAVVTDKLQQGFTFARLTKATKIKADGTKTDVTDAVTGPPAGDTVPEWNLGNIGKDSYELEFTSVATDAWRDTNLIAKDPDKVEVPNAVQLTGEIVSDVDASVHQAITNAKADAAQTIEKKPLIKGGKYNSEKGTIDWTVILNENQHNIKDWTLVETLKEPDKPLVHELDVDSINVVEITKDGDGANVTETAGTQEDVTIEGFSYKFKEISGGKNDKTYKITFTTYLTKEAEKDTAVIQNKVYMKDADDNKQEESGESNGGYTGGFDINEVGGAETRPRITVHKISGNSVAENDEDKSLALIGAEFQLVAYSFTVTDGTIELGTQELKRYSKGDAVSDENGDIYFRNIVRKSSDDKELIYVLEETKAPGGYQQDIAPRFIYFGAANLTGMPIEYKGQPYLSPLLTTVGEDGKVALIIYENKTIPAEFAFTKQQVQSISADGTADAFENVANGKVQFKLTPKDHKNKVKTKYAVADENGRLKFENLDAGTYILTEVLSDTGMSVGGTAEMVVTWDASGGTDSNGAYTYTLQNAQNGITIDSGNNTILRDDLTRGKLEFTKYAQYADNPESASNPNGNKMALGGATFVLEGQAKIGKSIRLETLSAADTGKVIFDNIPAGNYEVFEVPSNPVQGGYVQPTAGKEKIYTVTAEEVEDREQNLGTSSDGQTTYFGKKIKLTVTPVRADKDEGGVKRKDTATTVDNTPVRGKISFTKVIKDDILTGISGTPLKDVTFGLYRTLGTDTADKPTYTASSNDQGTVTFEGVEYADYVLKEIPVPAGFVAEKWKILKADLVPVSDTSNPAFDYTLTEPGLAPGNVGNQLYKTSINLTKRDQDHTPVDGVVFDVYRRGTQDVSSDGTGFVAEPEAAVKSFKRYKLAGDTVTTAGGGKIALSTLPYGDYLLVEQNTNSDVQEGSQNKVVLVCIKGQNDINIYEQNNPSIDLENTATPSTNDWNAQEWSKINRDNNTSADVINDFKYGYINISKRAAEVVYSGDTAIDLDSRITRPVAGAEFQIQKKAGDTWNNYLKLTTDANGNFAKAGTGYQDLTSNTKKHLLYGDYRIKETKAPDGVGITSLPQIPEDGIEFTIADNTTGMGGTVYIQNSGSNVLPIYKKSTEAAPTGIAYHNIIERATFSLQKKEKGGTQLLSQAQFIVYDKTTPVASLKEDTTNKGNYYLSDVNPQGGTFQAKKALAGISEPVPYLYKTDGKFRILSGTYTIKETKVPYGYLKAEDINVRIAQSGVTFMPGTDGQIHGSAVGNVITMEDQKILSSISLTKVYKNTTTPIEKVVFGLVDDTSKQTIASKSTDANGKLTFADVPEGKYVVREMPEASITAGVAEDVDCRSWESKVLTVNKDTAGQTIAVNATGNVENEKFAAKLSLTKRDQKRTDTKLQGVTFLLEKKDASGTYQPFVQDANNGEYLTKSGGTLTVANLTRGSYRLTETKTIAGYVLGTQPFSCTFELKTGDGAANVVISKANVDSKKWGLEATAGADMLSADGIYNAPANLTFKKMGESAENCSDPALGAPAPGTVSPLAGVEFTAHHTTDLTVPDKTAISNKQGIVTFEGLKQGTYKVTETNTVSGYHQSVEEYTATVTDSGVVGLLKADGNPLTDNTVVNKAIRTSIELKKVNEKDPSQPLPGSEYGLYKRIPATRQSMARLAMQGSQTATTQNLQLIATAVTDANGILKFEGVLAGQEYIVRELKAPDGSHVSANPITISFVIDIDGAITPKVTDTGGGTVEQDPITGAITWLEPPIEVSVEKHNEKGELLAGAVLQIVDRDNNVILEWTSSGDVPQSVRGILTAGKPYRLVEKSAPDGYQIAVPMEFTVDTGAVGPDAGKVLQLVMVDKPIETPANPADPSGGKNTKNGNSAKTGDAAPLIPYVTVMVLAAGIVISILRRKRKEKQ